MLHVFVGSSAMLRKRARLRSLALVLLLAAVTLIELGTADPSFSRQVCGLSSTALLLYASGLSPGSPASARCERCIISFASSRVDQASGADTFFAYKKDSVLSCHAVYLASVMAMRETCIDCKTEIDGLRQAIEEPKNSCNVPMQKAIDLGHERCQSISLESFPLGPKVAGIECELRLVDALTVFHDGGTANETSCVKSLRSVKEEAQRRKDSLSNADEADRIQENGIPSEFEEVDGLVREDMLAAMDLTFCYAQKPFSLADRLPDPFCACLTDGGTDDDPSPALAGAIKVFQTTQLATFGVRSLIRESFRTILIDIAKCYNLPENAFLKSNSSNARVTPSPSITPSPRPERFHGPDLNPSCFSANELVTLENGSIIPMHLLKVGDRVQVGRRKFSDVFMFTHRVQHVKSIFVELLLENGAFLPISPGHYVYANDLLVMAAHVRRGDVMTVADGTRSRVQMITYNDRAGLYNPQTLNGDIIVNGVLVSTYTSAVPPVVAHASLAMVRALYRATGKDFSTGYFETSIRSALTFARQAFRAYLHRRKQ